MGQVMEARHAALVKLYGDGTDPALAARLLKMRGRDQEIRTRFFSNQNFNLLSSDQQKQLSDEMTATDADLTAQLKRIAATKGWPTMPLVGVKASDAAALLLDHTPDLAWLKSLLPRIQELVAQNKILGDNIASIVDKTLKARGKPQRFGTYFEFRNGVMILWPVEDPANLDKLREQYFLPPMAENIRMMEHYYHMKAQ